MTTKKKFDDGGFVIELPEDVEKQIPFMVRGLVKDAIESLNKIDWNHDNKRDVAQIAPFVIKALPVLIELSKLIDWQKLIAWVIQQFAKDKPAASANATKIAALVDEASKEVNIT